MGTVPMHHVVPRLSGTPGEIRTPAPALGEHNDAILGGLGLDAGGDRRPAQTESHMSDATDRKLPVWRSALYVPANVPRFIDGAHKRGADAIIVDLEDSVPIAERPAARRDLMATAENVARGGADVIVRINRPWRQTMLDLEAAISPRVKALAVTKVDSADHIRLIAEVVSELEAERGMAVGTTQFIAMIETPDAWFQDAGDRQGRSSASSR